MFEQGEEETPRYLSFCHRREWFVSDEAYEACRQRTEDEIRRAMLRSAAGPADKRLEALSVSNPVVHAMLSAQKRGQCSMGRSLVEMVLKLAEMNDHLQRQAMDCLQRAPVIVLEPTEDEWRLFNRFLNGPEDSRMIDIPTGMMLKEVPEEGEITFDEAMRRLKYEREVREAWEYMGIGKGQSTQVDEPHIR